MYIQEATNKIISKVMMAKQELSALASALVDTVVHSVQHVQPELSSTISHSRLANRVITNLRTLTTKASRKLRPTVRTNAVPASTHKK